MANLNPVETTVTVAGTKVHFIQLQLNQAFNAHHTFRIEIDFEEFGGKWMDDPTKLINFIGKDVNITMKHKETGEQNLFSGVISNVSFSGYHGQQNIIVITGCSPTIKLAGKPTMDSFMDVTLQQVATEAVGNSGNGCAVTVNPVFGGKIDYLCQYNETCFDFLNRLSWEYGEWFFYDGITCYFGKTSGDSATLEYDKEMTYFDLSANLAPGKFNRYHYLNHDDKEIDKDDPGSVPGVRGYLEVAKGRSSSVYTSDANIPLASMVNTKKDLDDLVKAEKSRAVGEMLIMRGQTQTCKVKIGSKISIKLPSKMDVAVKSVDTFLITSVSHTIDQKGYYSNSFEGVMSEIEVIPMAEPTFPIAAPQIATIKSNDDEKQLGRVKAETQWQKKVGKTTNWIRVQTPDAGKSDDVPKNRGFVFIPEKDDIVMLGFEYGDPSRPFVMGSIFSEKVSIGGGVGNHIKTITDKSGGQLLMNTDEGGAWGITIHDRNGNVVQLDTKGKNIFITAPETIQLTANNIIMSAATNITSSAGEDITSTAGKNVSTSAGSDMMDIVRNNYKMMASNITELAKENYQSDANSIKQVAVKDIVIQSTGGKVVKNAKTRINNNSGEKSTFH